MLRSILTYFHEFFQRQCIRWMIRNRHNPHTTWVEDQWMRFCSNIEFKLRDYLYGRRF